MTEKHYGGASSHGLNDKASKPSSSSKNMDKSSSKSKNIDNNKSQYNKSSIEGYSDYIKAGKIASEVVAYAKSFIKHGMPLLQIANKIDDKIIELGGKPAFPVNLSINEIAAHSTPSWNDDEKASGLLKVDIGVHVNGCTADTAFSLDLDNNDENKKLIKASQKALDSAIEKINLRIKTHEIGKEIEKAIKSENCQPIINLSGHSISQYDLHAGITIPNYDNSQELELEEGVYAIEPFATNGLGTVRDGKPSGIYKIQKEGNVRDNFAREVLNFIIEEYSTLPFCSRWIYKKFGARGLLALKRIEEANILHQYSQLVESGKGKVAQSEHTIILSGKEKIVTTL